jgi:transposase
MEQINLSSFLEKNSIATKLDNLTKTELIQRYEVVEGELLRVLKENYSLRNQSIEDEQLSLLLNEQLDDLKNKIFGSSSERYKKKEPNKDEKNKEPSKPQIKRPSERYPNIPVVEKKITINPEPQCSCCQSVMVDSGMTEDSEQLTVIPKKFEIIKLQRVKYRCEKCHGDIQTAPAPPRIIEGSTYSDEMILDVVLSKYCDLIPIERYAAMAGRSGLIDLPPHSLIGLTHEFADFVIKAYYRVKNKTLESRVLNGDETPHRMLEGSDKKSWYLWGFSTPTTCFLECHDSRSGDVASQVLLKSKCEILITDVYSGYGKAVGIANKSRLQNSLKMIRNAYCNAHSRRYFFKSRDYYTKESEFYLDLYHEIYKLNADSKGKPPDEILKYREEMKIYFKKMKNQALEDLPRYPRKNKFFKALNYYLENYEGLTLFLDDPEVPIDNNAQERIFRSHVVGRKTWYGTHSERGAQTAAILFSLVESCKLNHVNPRDYLNQLVQDLLAGKSAFTPEEYKINLKK